MFQKVAFTAVVVLLSACTGGGPRTGAILNASSASVVERETVEPFALVTVDRDIARAISRSAPPAPAFFRDTGPGRVVIGTGDVLQITIVSTSATGFVDFTSSSISPVSSATLPPQTVSEVGTVNVPPIGRIQAQGQTLPAFENALEARLGQVLVDPSVIVQMVDRRSARVTLVGRVGGSGSVPLNEVDTRLVDVIAAAGGPQGRAEDLVVTVSRRGHTRSLPMSELFENPRYNIHALPGDVISVDTPQRKLVVLGAGGSNQTLRFDEPEVSLAEAMGRIGGLQSRRADRRGVFLYRQVPRATVAGIGADLTGFAGEMIPTVFRFDFREPTVMFTASEFQIADGDILYISDNFNEEVAGVISALSPFVPPPVTLVNDALEN